MKAFHRSPVQRLSAAIAATATTMLLFSAVVDLSEPQRGKLIAANAARQATRHRPRSIRRGSCRLWWPAAAPNGAGIQPPAQLQARRQQVKAVAVAASAVFDAERDLRKPMDLVSWPGANRSDTGWYREDLQQRHGAKDAVLCRA